ncbi:hypothetical protein PR048_012127 [Dryococelus australis]|uniref:Uncharacterized protein n=1 Tax=Dryococelus australis TaxID=614101 RepID=A0ABQ9HP94_9NEOP|nr:hypothetical protein PR048_012127 [Dryococelus australis]
MPLIILPYHILDYNEVPGILHHDLVNFSFSLTVSKFILKFITYHNIKTIDDIQLNRDAAAMPWHLIRNIH